MAAAEPADANAPPRRRVFFALWPDETTRSALFRAGRAAVRQSGGRPTRAANLHVTLAFLGPITESDLARVSALDPPRSAPFELVFDRLGLWESSRVLWAAPTECPEALLQLERELWDRLVALGFERERRAYRPHVTIARKAQAARGDFHAVAWRVTDLALVESRPSPRSARYEILRVWDFG
jgi:2'-5' RNA ligase